MFFEVNSTEIIHAHQIKSHISTSHQIHLSRSSYNNKEAGGVRALSSTSPLINTQVVDQKLKNHNFSHMQTNTHDLVQIKHL